MRLGWLLSRAIPIEESANTLAAGTIEALAESSAARRANCTASISPPFVGSFIVQSPNNAKD